MLLGDFSNVPGRFAERFRNVGKQRSRGTKRRIFVGNSEAGEPVHLENAANGFSSDFRIKLPIRRAGNKIPLQQRVEAFRRASLLPRFRNENFARTQRLKRGEQRFAFPRCGDAKFRRRNIEPCGVKPGAVVVERENVVVAFRVELRIVERRSRRNDSDESAFDELARRGRFRLLANGNFYTGVERFLQIGLHGVIRHARKRRSRAFREREPEQLRPALRVRTEHFIKIPDTEKQQRIGRELVSKFPILLDHRGLVQIGGHCGELSNESFCGSKEISVPAREREKTLARLGRKCFLFGFRLSGRSAVWLARFVRDEEVGGSNPLAPTIRTKARSNLRAFLLFRRENFSMSLKEKHDEILAELAPFEDMQERFQYLIDRAKSAPALAAEHRVPANLVEGCTSQLWLVCRFEGGVCRIDVDADAVITKGIATLIRDYFDGAKPEEILSDDVNFLASVGIDQHLSPNRRNGLSNLVGKIHAFARAHLS